jgi:nitrate reductase gamma subunit
MLVLIGYVIPYVAIAVFLIGMTARTWGWLKTPVPHPLPIEAAGDGCVEQTTAVARELLVFRSLLRSDRILWLCAWLMHVALAVVLFGHIVGIAFLSQQFCYVGASPATSIWLSQASALISGLVLAAALVGLLFRRVALPHVKRLSDPADFFDLLLLLTIVVTGLHMRLVAEVDLVAIRSYLGGLMTFRFAPLPVEVIFLSHFTLVNLLLIYFPFSKLVHLTGAIVARALVVQPPPKYPTPVSVVSSTGSSNPE